MLINRLRSYTTAAGLLSLIVAGCNNRSNTDLSYKAAINDHFKAGTPSDPLCSGA